MNISCRIMKHGWIQIKSKQSFRFVEIITIEQAKENKQNIYFTYNRKNFFICISEYYGDRYENRNFLHYTNGSIVWKK